MVRSRRAHFGLFALPPAICLTTSALAVALALVACGPKAQAQYMFLDSDGDGRNTLDDRMAHRGETWVDIWVRTDANRDGSRAQIGGMAGDFGLHSYHVILRAHGGTVRWGKFANRLRGAVVFARPSSDSTEYHVSALGKRSLRPGTYRLGRVGTRVVTGLPSVSIVSCSVSDSTLVTSFSPQPHGSDLVFGPTIRVGREPLIVKGDWFDADGLLPPELRPSAGPVVINSGILYLGWNRITPPYKLEFVSGSVAANGRRLPERELARPSIGPEVMARQTLQFLAGQAADALLHCGYSDSVSREASANLCRESPVVDSVRVGDKGGLTIWFRGQPRPSAILRLGLSYGTEWARSMPDPDSVALRDLRGWAAELEQGALLCIHNRSSTTSIGKVGAVVADRAILRLQNHRPLTSEDSTALAGLPVGEISMPVRLQRTKR